MKAMHEALRRLLSPNRPTAHSDFLAFLAERAPRDIAEQIADDGEPDLGLSKHVSAADIMRPLRTGTFPAQGAWELADILNYILTCYRIAIEENPAAHDPYKVIYATSLFLYCYLKAGAVPDEGVYLPALTMMAQVSSQQDIETRAQVCRFLGSMIEPVEAVGFDFAPAPVSGVLIALGLVAGSLVRDLSVVAEQIARSEKLVLNWSEREKDSPRTSNTKAIVFLRRWISDMFGRGGEIRRATGRFASLCRSPSDDTGSSTRGYP